MCEGMYLGTYAQIRQVRGLSLILIVVNLFFGGHYGAPGDEAGLVIGDLSAILSQLWHP